MEVHAKGERAKLFQYSIVGILFRNKDLKKTFLILYLGQYLSKVRHLGSKLCEKRNAKMIIIRN